MTRAPSGSRPRVALAWAPALFYMAVIWALSSMELASISVSRFPFGDKGVHVVEYAVLGFLVAHATLRTWPRHHPMRTAALAILVTFLWGFVDEIHQAMVPGRSSEALDLLADFIGATSGALLRYAASLVLPRLATQEER